MATVKQTNDLRKKLNLKSSISIFSNLGSAKDSLKYYVKRCWVIVLGDDSKFWVVNLSDASMLEKSGYEVLWNKF